MEVKLRKLQMQDAEWMLEWMHDENLVKDLQTDFLSKTIADCLSFIEHSSNDQENIHLAVANPRDVYLGTVSLKHIANGYAEFGIAMRRMAIGKGVAVKAMVQILEYGFAAINLNEIYWCVDTRNLRAVKFYDKNGFRKVQLVAAGNGRLARELRELNSYTNEQMKEYIWYSIKKNNFQNEIYR